MDKGYTFVVLDEDKEEKKLELSEVREIWSTARSLIEKRFKEIKDFCEEHDISRENPIEGIEWHEEILIDFNDKYNEIGFFELDDDDPYSDSSKERWVNYELFFADSIEDYFAKELRRKQKLKDMVEAIEKEKRRRQWEELNREFGPDRGED